MQNTAKQNYHGLVHSRPRNEVGLFYNVLSLHGRIEGRVHLGGKQHTNSLSLDPEIDRVDL